MMISHWRSRNIRDTDEISRLAHIISIYDFPRLHGFQRTPASRELSSRDFHVASRRRADFSIL